MAFFVRAVLSGVRFVVVAEIFSEVPGEKTAIQVGQFLENIHCIPDELEFCIDPELYAHGRMRIPNYRTEASFRQILQLFPGATDNVRPDAGASVLCFAGFVDFLRELVAIDFSKIQLRAQEILDLKKSLADRKTASTATFFRRLSDVGGVEGLIAAASRRASGGPVVVPGGTPGGASADNNSAHLVPTGGPTRGPCRTTCRNEVPRQKKTVVVLPEEAEAIAAQLAGTSEVWNRDGPMSLEILEQVEIFLDRSSQLVVVSSTEEDFIKLV